MRVADVAENYIVYLVEIASSPTNMHSCCLWELIYQETHCFLSTTS